MKTFLSPLPDANPVPNAGDHIGDHSKIRDALVEIRNSVPSSPAEVGAAPATLLDGNSKVKDASLASNFVKSINGQAPDTTGDIAMSIGSNVDTSTFVKTSTDQNVSGVKTFSSPPVSTTAATVASQLVRKAELDLKADASTTVNLASAQTLTGVKTFSNPPVSSAAATTANQLVRKNELDLKADASAVSAKANDVDVVKLAGAQSVTGVKTFTNPPVSATNATANTQLPNFGQVKSLIPGAGTPAANQAVQTFTGFANGTATDYSLNVVPNGDATGASATVQNGALKFVTPTGGGEVNRLFWWSDSPTDDGDIYATVWFDGTGSDMSGWLGYRIPVGRTTADRSDGIYVFLDPVGNQVSAGRALNTAWTTYAPATSLTFGTTHYRTRALLQGQRFRFKIWPVTSTEPAAWLIDATDSISFSGMPANIGYMSASSTSGGSYIDDLSWNVPATGTVFAQTVNGVSPDTSGNVTTLRMPNAISAAYTVSVNDVNCAVESTASTATTITIPTDATSTIPIGAEIHVIKIGTGNVTISGASGVTLIGTTSIATQYARLVLRKRGPNSWISN